MQVVLWCVLARTQRAQRLDRVWRTDNWSWQTAVPAGERERFTLDASFSTPPTRLWQFSHRESDIHVLLGTRDFLSDWLQLAVRELPPRSEIASMAARLTHSFVGALCRHGVTFGSVWDVAAPSRREHVAANLERSLHEGFKCIHGERALRWPVLVHCERPFGSRHTCLAPRGCWSCPCRWTGRRGSQTSSA